MSREACPPVLGEGEADPYDRTFWISYAANTAIMVAVSILFRYADFIHHLGGREMELGIIVGTGMIGALAMRVFQGIGIDRFGPRIVWLGSVALFILSVLGHVLVTRIDSPAVYLLRVLFTIATAGAFGASITFVSLRVPEHRLGEMIGVLGSSGFLGMALGPTLGDWLLANGPITRPHIDQMFYLAALAATVSFVLVAIATRHEVKRELRRQPPMLWLLKRYHPGPLLLVSLAMGVGLGLPQFFLKAYAAELAIPRIKTFFLVYAGSAFLIRIVLRRWTDRVGVRPVALGGLLILSASMLLYLTVRNEWTLAIPAALSGIAHAFLFPAVMSGGSVAFPSRYRGLATTVMLATFDLGNLLGQPTVGGIVHTSRQMGLEPYAVMFVSVSVFLAVVAGVYYWLSREPEPEPAQNPARVTESVSAPTPAPVIVPMDAAPLEVVQPSTSDR